MLIVEWWHGWRHAYKRPGGRILRSANQLSLPGRRYSGETRQSIVFFAKQMDARVKFTAGPANGRTRLPAHDGGEFSAARNRRYP
jgi:hypothetical protein